MQVVVDKIGRPPGLFLPERVWRDPVRMQALFGEPEPFSDETITAAVKGNGSLGVRRGVECVITRKLPT